jgi:glycosyltransferase involved in cell wall biosynthesis
VTELRAVLDAPLPEEVAVGAGTALFVCGWCFCPHARLCSLELLVGGERQQLDAFGMPRLDLIRELGEPGSYRSGFWGIARIMPRRARQLELGLRGLLDTGEMVDAPLATIALSDGQHPAAAMPADAAPSVAICMATHNPPPDLVTRQVDSIRAQTHRSWICLVSDDCSSPSGLAALREAIAEDDRFVLSRSSRRLGFYRNFERALSMVPRSVPYVAMADQDDFWYPDKLATLLDRIGEAQLIYSDARVVARDGETIADTYWSRRRNNHDDMLSLLVANSVTGAASLLRRELLDDALPFPPAQFAHYHDHWIALTALARGHIRFVSRPLYDYVQHDSASLGHATANQMRTFRDRLRSLRTRRLRDRVRKWRMHYFVDIARLTLFATVLEMRVGHRMMRSKRRALRRISVRERSPLTLMMLAARGVRELVGRPETLGAEWMLFGALLWRDLLPLSARSRPQQHLRLDAVPPPDLAPGPERAGPASGSTVSAIAAKLAPLALELRDGAPPRVNLLIPTVDLEHLFGGYIAKLNLARRLAERGARVRVVTTDPTARLPRSWAHQLESYEGLGRLTDRVEFLFGRESPGIEVSGSDSFIATTWWTAHIAGKALAELGRARFLYLIQEYEPFTFPMGTYAALAAESYELPHRALFSSELLREFFRRRGIGVYSAGVQQGDSASASFENAITPVSPPSADQLAERRLRRLLFYARPEPHAARNLYELGTLALSRALDLGGFQSGWELRGVGTVSSRQRLALAGGAELELLPRAGQGEYARLLSQHDVGLALMYTPHPSLVPIEMAAAGMLAVTNSFEHKTPAALAEISENLIVARPTVEGVAEALIGATRGLGDVARRVRGSHVRWSRDWQTSFGDELMAKVEAWLSG